MAYLQVLSASPMQKHSSFARLIPKMSLCIQTQKRCLFTEVFTVNESSAASLQTVILHTHFPKHAWRQDTHTHIHKQVHKLHMFVVRLSVWSLIPYNPQKIKNQTSQIAQIVTEGFSKNRKRIFDLATLNMFELLTIQLDQRQKLQFTVYY